MRALFFLEERPGLLNAGDGGATGEEQPESPNDERGRDPVVVDAFDCFLGFVGVSSFLLPSLELFLGGGVGLPSLCEPTFDFEMPVDGEREDALAADARELLRDAREARRELLLLSDKSAMEIAGPCEDRGVLIVDACAENDGRADDGRDVRGISTSRSHAPKRRASPFVPVR